MILFHRPKGQLPRHHNALIKMPLNSQQIVKDLTVRFNRPSRAASARCRHFGEKYDFWRNQVSRSSSFHPFVTGEEI